MDSVAVLLIGFGAYLMYEAYKNKQPAPVAKAQAALVGNKAVA